MTSNGNNDSYNGGYEGLVVYQTADCIYALTHHFVDTVFQRGDRTYDQMLQAARSAKQNIAEGSEDGKCSTHSELYLMGVAKGSAHELLADYKDYLTHHGLERWTRDDARTRQTRAFARRHKDPELYLERARQRTPETVANIAITLLHIYDVLMERLLKSVTERFLRDGGLKEQLTRARLAERDKAKTGTTGRPGMTGKPGHHSQRNRPQAQNQPPQSAQCPPSQAQSPKPQCPPSQTSQPSQPPTKD